MGLLKEFKDFLMRGNLIELAVAFVMGVAFAALLNSFVADVVTPIIGAIAGKPDFSALSFTINKSHFMYGSFINAVIQFVLIAAAIFFFVVKPVSAMMARGKAGEDAVPPTDIDLLTEIRDLLKARG